MKFVNAVVLELSLKRNPYKNASWEKSNETDYPKMMEVRGGGLAAAISVTPNIRRQCCNGYKGCVERVL